MAEKPPASRNVDALIEKLRADGVQAGREEAARLRAEAEREAAQTLATARAEAEALREQARRDVERFEAAGREALRLAMRDAIMMMKSDLIAQLEADVRRMVSNSVAEPEMLRRMILELVGAARDDAGAGPNTDILLPEHLLSGHAADAGDIAAAQSDDALSRFALGLAQEMLQRGVVFYADEALGVGLRARVRDKDLTIDLSDEAIAALLMRHLQPRFRAVLDGVIR